MDVNSLKRFKKNRTNKSVGLSEQLLISHGFEGWEPARKAVC